MRAAFAFTFALALLLAGCGAPEKPDEAACERQAENNPAVHELIIKGLGNPAFQAESQQSLALARRQATLACLRSRGLAPPGGVEPRRPG